MNKIRFVLYLSLFTFPLFGDRMTGRPLAAMVIVSFLTCLIYLYQVRRDKKPVYEVPGLFPLACLLAFLLVQIVPLPPLVVKYLAPASYRMYHGTLGIIAPDHWFPISVNMGATVSEFFRYASHTAFYFLTVQFLSHRETVKKTLLSLIGFIGIFATLSLFHWLITTRMPTPLSGPYVDRNHYAGLMAMILPLTLAMFLYYRPGGSYEPWKERLISLFRFPGDNRYLFYGAAFIMGTISLFFTMSRGGIVSFCLSITFFLVMLPGRKLIRQNRSLFGVLVVMIIFLVGITAWEAIFNRVDRLADPRATYGRAECWADSLRIFGESWLFGTGFGTFSTIIKAYTTAPAPWPISHAHNDYLEFLTQGGLVGLVLLLWFFKAYLKPVIPQFIKRKDRFAIYMFLAAMAGLLSILCHSVTDFNLQIGANALYFFFLLGMGVSAAFTTFHATRRHTALNPVSETNLKKWLVLAWGTGVTAIGYGIGMAIAFQHSHLAQDFYTKDKLTNKEVATINTAMHRAMAVDPLDATYCFISARTHQIMGNTTQADADFRKAIFRYPSQSLHLQAFGRFKGNMGDMETARRLFQAAIDHGRFTPRFYLDFADFLWDTGDVTGYTAQIKNALTITPSRFKKIFPQLLEKFPNEKEMVEAFPERVFPYQHLGDYLVTQGKKDDAEAAYLMSLDYIGNETGRRTGFFMKVIRFYAREKRYDDALDIVKKGLVEYPGDVRLRIEGAQYYEKMGVVYRAAEEYKKVIALDPTNAVASKRLAELEISGQID